jgi:hypothetical protein
MKMRNVTFVLMILITAGIFLILSEGRAESLRYVNEDIGFSFEYPADYKAEPAQSPIEVARFVNQNEFNIPVYTAGVRERSEDMELEDIPERIIKSMEETIPYTSNYNIIENKNVNLSDGSDAVIFQFEWVWVDGITVMESVIIGAFKGDKQITVSGTTVQGLGYSLEQIYEYCMTLSLTI